MHELSELQELEKHERGYWLEEENRVLNESLNLLNQTKDSELFNFINARLKEIKNLIELNESLYYNEAFTTEEWIYQELNKVSKLAELCPKNGMTYKATFDAYNAKIEYHQKSLENRESIQKKLALHFPATQYTVSKTPQLVTVTVSVVKKLGQFLLKEMDDLLTVFNKVVQKKLQTLDNPSLIGLSSILFGLITPIIIGIICLVKFVKFSKEIYRLSTKKEKLTLFEKQKLASSIPHLFLNGFGFLFSAVVTGIMLASIFTTLSTIGTFIVANAPLVLSIVLCLLSPISLVNNLVKLYLLNQDLKKVLTALQTTSSITKVNKKNLEQVIDKKEHLLLRNHIQEQILATQRKISLDLVAIGIGIGVVLLNVFTSAIAGYCLTAVAVSVVVFKVVDQHYHFALSKWFKDKTEKLFSRGEKPIIAPAEEFSINSDKKEIISEAKLSSYASATKNMMISSISTPSPVMPAPIDKINKKVGPQINTELSTMSFLKPPPPSNSFEVQQPPIPSLSS